MNTEQKLTSTKQENVLETPVIAKIRSYYELTKPGIAQLVLISAAVGYLAGIQNFLDFFFYPSNVLHFLTFLVGVYLVASAGGSLNHYVERDVDAVMERTAGRPLPSGRIAPSAALLFSIFLAFIGLGLLAFVNFITLLLAVITLITYIVVYTPLKRFTQWNTYLGAIPGALPPLAGWIAATNTIGIAGFLLFAVLYFWQMPHFFSLAWLYRAQYEKAQFRMLPVVEKTGKHAAFHAFANSILLVAVVAYLGVWLHLNILYWIVTLPLGFFLLWKNVRFLQHPSDNTARGLLGACYFYLPVQLLMILIGKL